MLVILPKKMVTVGGDLLLPSAMPLFKLTAVKNGVFLYNSKGGLIGQVFCKKNRAEISVADGRTVVLTVTKDGRSQFSCLTDEPSVNQMPEYTAVGDVRTFCYQVFERDLNVKMPHLALQVFDDPVHNNYYKAKLDDNSNPIRLLLFAAAIALLNEKVRS